MISSQPYNPEALGKVETSRREQHHKFYYEMKKLKNKVVSWVENLSNYMRVFKRFDTRRAGRKSNVVAKASHNNELDAYFE